MDEQMVKDSENNVATVGQFKAAYRAAHPFLRVQAIEFGDQIWIGDTTSSIGIYLDKVEQQPGKAGQGGDHAR
jgi:hypothetical protein